MHTEHKREDPLVDMGYEVRDVNYSALGKATLGFFGFTIASFLAGWVILVTGVHVGPIQIDGFNPTYTDKKPDKMRRVPAPGIPLVQNNVDAKLDISKMREEEDALLSGTGYKDKTKQIVRIPVDRAMDLLIQRGIAPAPAEIPAKSVGHRVESLDQPVSAEPAAGGN